MCWRRQRRWAPEGVGGGLVSRVVDLSGYVAFQATEDFSAGFAFRLPPLGVFDGAGVDA